MRDRAAFATFYADTSVELYNQILGIIGGQNAAEKIMRETYVEIWDNPQDYKTLDQSPLDWLTNRVEKKAAKLLNQRKRAQRRRCAAKSRSECSDLFYETDKLEISKENIPDLEDSGQINGKICNKLESQAVPSKELYENILWDISFFNTARD